MPPKRREGIPRPSKIPPYPAELGMLLQDLADHHFTCSLCYNNYLADKGADLEFKGECSAYDALRKKERQWYLDRKLQKWVKGPEVNGTL